MRNTRNFLNFSRNLHNFSMIPKIPQCDQLQFFSWFIYCEELRISLKNEWINPWKILKKSRILEDPIRLRCLESFDFGQYKFHMMTSNALWTLVFSVVCVLLFFCYFSFLLSLLSIFSVFAMVLGCASWMPFHLDKWRSSIRSPFLNIMIPVQCVHVFM